MLTVGSVVCGYRIQRLLGSGGMGAVYQATDPSLPRQIALKVVSAERSRRKYDPVVWLGDKLFRR
jgi:serine/threonine protein kinase